MAVLNNKNGEAASCFLLSAAGGSVGLSRLFEWLLNLCWWMAGGRKRLMLTPKTSLRHGFTLIELSLVIVVVGLLVGVVVGAREMYRNQEYRGIAVDARAYLVAAEQFKQLYRYPPGDFPAATDVWGALASCPNEAATGKATCNGDGDGLIETTNVELFRAWQHLANAGLIGGSYTGSVFASGEIGVVVKDGVNAPLAPVYAGFRSPVTGIYRKATFLFSYRNLSIIEENTGTPLFPGDYRNVLGYGSSWLNVVTGAPAISAKDALYIDKKYDDGAPASGNIVTAKIYVPYYIDCTTSNDLDAAYDITKLGDGCNLFFKTSFVTSNNQ